ncbi:MAG: hypothetical protein QF535_07025, partial [Anaerolineales bacterium]|nr:hypothetical protein [Anaerolineales bacterium]
KDCLEEIIAIPECEQVSQPTTGPGITVTPPTEGEGVLLTDTEPIEIGLPAGTTSTTISLTTDEPATCKYSTTAGIDYEDTSMITFGIDARNELLHSNQVSDLVDDTPYYVECRTDAGEEDTVEIRVRIDQPPVLTILRPSPPSPSVSVDVGEQITVEFEVRDDIGISKIMPGNQDGVLDECNINVVSALPHSQDDTEIIIPEGDYVKSTLLSKFRINCEQPVEDYEFLITVVSRDSNGEDAAQVSEGVTLSFVETTAPTTSIVSVEGDTSEPYYDTVDNDYTDVVITGEVGRVCEGYTSARDYVGDDNIGEPCNVLDDQSDQATCRFSTPTSGDNTYYVACADSLGNGQDEDHNLEITWTVDITPPEITVVYPTEELLPIGTR